MQDKKQALTVSQLNFYIKSLVAADEILSALTVKGEVSNFTRHRYGHLYFTLKDGDASIRAVMFAHIAKKLPFDVQNGMGIIVFGRADFYDRDGSVRLYCEAMEPDGVGALALAFEQLKTKLQKEGLFDENRKKPIPQFPRKIAVITSKTGAVIKDIINVISRRYQDVTIVLYPVEVQGEKAVTQIESAFKALETAEDTDVVILARGGGSIEDLWSFNDEKVARAIFNCRIPVISAVGHETDFTIADFAADLRAPTPSAAAELCVPDAGELKARLMMLYNKLGSLSKGKTALLESKLKMLASYPVLSNPYLYMETAEHRLKNGVERLAAESRREITACRAKLKLTADMLSALNPLNVLTRGYTIVKAKGKPMLSVSEVQVGDALDIFAADGSISATAVEIKKKQQ